jgi:DnaA family protein
LAALYLPAEELETLDPAIFEALESYDLVCIDDLQLLLGKPEWEQALFHLYNRLRDTGRRLLISANNTPAHLAVGLADLASRLTWGLVFQLQPLNDADKLAALDAQARARGLVIAEDVLQFLLNHSDRNLRILMRQLDQLDSASLEQKRRVTIPFVKQVLGWS